MGATLATIDAALKETWTTDRIVSQLYDDNPFLDELQKTKRYKVGAQAVTPIVTNRNGGYTAHPAAGSSALNAAGNVGLAQAVWNYTYHAQQIQLERAAVDGTEGREIAVANVVDVEVEGAVSELRKQITRQVVGGAGDALIAQCTTGGASTTVNLLSTGFGPDALSRGWLHPGLTVDIGTTASEAALAADTVISGVSTVNNTITIGASVTTTSSHYVSIANARAGTTSYEMNGLRNLVSASADFGGITVASNPSWASTVDSTTTALTLDSLYTARRAVRQTTGGAPDYVLTSLKQEENFYKLLQMQVRFNSDEALGAGKVESAKFAGMRLNAHPDVPDRLAFLLSMKHLFILENDKPGWTDRYTGGGRLEWKQGTTAIVGALFYDCQLGTDRRNAHTALTALTA